MNNEPHDALIFFDSNSQGNTASPVPPTPMNSDEDYKPSFCNVADIASLGQKGPPQLEPRCALSASLAFPFLPSAQPRAELASSHLTKPRPAKESQPRPYDIAMELLARQPLRMVDNALHAFDGQIYRFVDSPTMNRLIMHLCRSYVYAVGDASIIDRVYKMIQAEPSIVYHPGDNPAPFVACDDGLLNLMDFSIGPFSPQPFVTVRLHGSYTRGQSASCPVFDGLLHTITDGNPVLIERIWQAIGYALVPDTGGKCFILFQGVPDSGKSLLGDIIASLIDQELVTSLDISAMGERFGASELVGKQLCLSMDMPSGALDPKSVSLFKNLTGGDVVSVDVKYQPRIKFRCSATFLVATNHPLLTRDQDPAFFRRAVTIPFRFAVEKEHQDHSLKARIWAERDAILYRALQAFARLRQANYQFSGDYQPNEVTFGQNNTNTDLHGILWDFCRDCCVEDEASFTSTAELYAAFCSFAKAPWPGGIRRFSDEAFAILSTLFPQTISRDRKRPKGTSGNPERGFSGIRLALN